MFPSRINRGIETPSIFGLCRADNFSINPRERKSSAGLSCHFSLLTNCFDLDLLFYTPLLPGWYDRRKLREGRFWQTMIKCGAFMEVEPEMRMRFF